MRHHVPVMTALLCLVGLSVIEARTWTDSTGKYQLEADFVDFNDGKVLLTRGDAQIIAIELSQFSQADQQYVRKELQRRRAA